MRFRIYDRWDAYVGELHALYAEWETSLSGTDQLTVRTFQELEQGWQIVWQDSAGSWHENTVDETQTDHSGGKPITEAICVNSIRETYNDYLDDIRPSNVSANLMLQRMLAASGTRWQLGPTDALGEKSKTFYHTSLREGLATAEKEYNAELETSIEVGLRGVTARYVGLRAQRGSDTGLRIVYGKNVKGIKRHVHPYEGKSALYGYGRGVETESGGFGRRLKITEANPTGLEYIAEPDLLPVYGRPDGIGGRAHSFGSAIYEQVEDPYLLYDLTNEALHSQVPPVTYTCDLAEVSVLDGHSLGDRILVIDNEFPTPLRLKARISRIRIDLLANQVTGEIEIGTESKTLADIVAAQNDLIGTLDSANLEAAIDELANVQPDRFYMYHGENEGRLQFSTETSVAALRFATVADTRVAVNFTVEHELNLDGDIIARIYINNVLMKTVETYEARGKALLDFMWSSEFVKDTYFDVRLTMEPVGVISQIRENDADNATLWNRSRANSKVLWQELYDTETWDSAKNRTWEDWASGSYATGTWGSLMNQDDIEWDIVEPSTAKPTVTIAPRQAQAILFGRGLAEVDSWNGEINVYDEISLSLVERGLGIGFSASLDASKQAVESHGLAESLSLSTAAAWLTVGYADAVAFGERYETVWASDLTDVPTAISASGASWSASAAASVDTVDFGKDMTVDGIASVHAAVTGDVAFSVSFDGGSTWLAYDGGWKAGAMDADALNAVTDWPSPPVRFRMAMAAGSAVNGMTIGYERSIDEG